MRKWLTKVRAASVAVLLATVLLSAASCEKYILPRLDCDKDTIWAAVGGGLYDVTLTSNVKWMIDDGRMADWVTIDNLGGESDYKEVTYLLKVNVAENATGAERKCDISYSSATLSRKLVVVQEGSASGSE